jgi:hypothetical protein
MPDKTKKLISLLEAATLLLQTHGANYRADWLSRAVEYLRSNNFYGIEH